LYIIGGILCPAKEKKKETLLPAKSPTQGSMAAKLKNHNT